MRVTVKNYEEVKMKFFKNHVYRNFLTTYLFPEVMPKVATRIAQIQWGSGGGMLTFDF